MKKTLTKFFTTPGYCTIKELVDSKLFLQDLREVLDIYISANGCHPLGGILDIDIKSIKWYIDRLDTN